MNKILRLILYAFCFSIILSTLSNHFDFDFGWHLQFGKDAETIGAFPYADTHTYTFFGQNWVNHEWGNDLLVWQIYQNFGYWPLLIFASIAILTAFIIVQKIFTPKITSLHLITTACLLVSIRHIMVMRPAMYSLLFFAILWWTLEKLPNKKTYYWWPPLIWTWSMMHGSWIFAFIVIGIYFIGNAINTIAKKYWPQAALPYHTWENNTYFHVALWMAITAAAVVINPYGLNIFKEVATYLDPAYFKNRVTEWIPSYAYPIFWQSLVWVAPAAILIFTGWRQKIISWPQILLFVALFASGWQYKRNMMFFVLICQPIISAGLAWIATTAAPLIANKFSTNSRRIIHIIFILIVSVLIFQTGKTIRLDRDIWQNKALLSAYDSPPGAIEFLKKELPIDKKTKIFNEFVWGGYLIWEVPQALIFLDGRGTVTWKLPGQNITAFEFYHDLVYNKPNGLDWIENSGAEYIILQRSNVGFYPPDAINRIMFSKDDFKKQFDIKPSLLEEQIKASHSWQLVYSDHMSLIWKRLPAR